MLLRDQEYFPTIPSVVENRFDLADYIINHSSHFSRPNPQTNSIATPDPHPTEKAKIPHANAVIAFLKRGRKETEHG